MFYCPNPPHGVGVIMIPILQIKNKGKHFTVSLDNSYRIEVGFKTWQSNFWLFSFTNVDSLLRWNARKQVHLESTQIESGISVVSKENLVHHESRSERTRLKTGKLLYLPGV